MRPLRDVTTDTDQRCEALDRVYGSGFVLKINSLPPEVQHHLYKLIDQHTVVMAQLVRDMVSTHDAGNRFARLRSHQRTRADRSPNIVLISSRGPKFPKPEPGTVPKLIDPRDLY